jgi:hypothetical protein
LIFIWCFAFGAWCFVAVSRSARHGAAAQRRVHYPYYLIPSSDFGITASDLVFDLYLILVFWFLGAL